MDIVGGGGLLAAEADLHSIVRYTRKQWGVAQARAY
jgi:plasmid stabilization system protein ParE